MNWFRIMKHVLIICSPVIVLDIIMFAQHVYHVELLYILYALIATVTVMLYIKEKEREKK